MSDQAKAPTFTLHDLAHHASILSASDLREGLMRYGVAESTITAVVNSAERNASRGFLWLYFQYESADTVRPALEAMMADFCAGRVEHSVVLNDY